MSLSDSNSSDGNKEVTDTLSAANVLCSRFSSVSTPSASSSKDNDIANKKKSSTKEDEATTIPNKSMTSQSLLSCVGKIDNVISLIEHFDRSNTTNTTSKKKSSIHQRSDLSLALKTLKKLRSHLNISTSDSTNTYSREAYKRKVIDDADDFTMQHGLAKRLKTSSALIHELNKNCQMCCELLKSSSPYASYFSKKVQKSDRKKKPVWHNHCILKKSDKEIFIPNPQTGFCYNPQEMVDIVCNKIDPQDKYFVVNQMVDLGLVPCKRRMALRYVEKYKKGKTIP